MLGDFLSSTLEVIDHLEQQLIDLLRLLSRIYKLFNEEADYLKLL